MNTYLNVECLSSDSLFRHLLGVNVWSSFCRLQCAKSIWIATSPPCTVDAVTEIQNKWLITAHELIVAVQTAGRSLGSAPAFDTLLILLMCWEAVLFCKPQGSIFTWLMCGSICEHCRLPISKGKCLRKEADSTVLLWPQCSLVFQRWQITAGGLRERAG